MSRYQRGEPNLVVPASQPPNIGLSRRAVLKISHSVRVGFSPTLPRFVASRDFDDHTADLDDDGTCIRVQVDADPAAAA